MTIFIFLIGSILLGLLLHGRLRPYFRMGLLCTGMLPLFFPHTVWTQADEDQIDRDTIVEKLTIPEDLMVRARVTAMKSPNGDTSTTIRWRYGGQGVSTGETKVEAMGESLPLGEWTPRFSVRDIMGTKATKRMYLGFLAGNPGKLVDRITRKIEGYSTGVEMDIEFSDGDKPLKTIHSKGPEGGTFTVVLPFYRLANNAPLDHPDFINELDDVLGYAKKRAERIESLPWASGPLPKKYPVFADLRGYGVGGGGYGIHFTDKEVLATEARTLHQLGVNGLRDSSPALTEEIAKGEGWAARFNRAAISTAGGFPVVRYRKGRPAAPGAGCPFSEFVPELTKEMIEQAKKNLLTMPEPEIWAITVDEIGSVFDGTPEGKSHTAVCDQCARAFRDFLKQEGRQPEEFGKTSWEEIRPLDVWSKDPEAPQVWLTDPHAALNAYYTRRFNNYATAKMFEPLKKFFQEENQKKATAIASGNLDSPEAKQPWVYTYALRGQTPVARGHSLDFFEFYRYADNGFFYETSSRDPRIWQWDSYMCDIGKTNAAIHGVRPAILVKPHRGAVIQRTLAAIARGFKAIYWYTYGPDYAKGDSFAHKEDALEATSRMAHLLAKAEDVTYDSEWVHPAEVALVTPFTLNALVQDQLKFRKKNMDPVLSADWEDAKWTYLALTHAHIPVQVIDEEYLENQDLSHLKAIYVPSIALRKASMEKLIAWIQAGGMLYTNAGGLSQDEARQSSDTLLHSVLGLQKRTSPEMWSNTPLGASLDSDKPGDVASIPEDASVIYDSETIPLTTGREILHPEKGAEVLATYKNGEAAMIRFPFGKGQVFVAGFFPALEYAHPLRTSNYDMSKDFVDSLRNLVAFPALSSGVRPLVDADSPLVEGILVNHKETGERSLILMNWGYRIIGNRVRLDESGKKHILGSVPELIAQKNLKVRLRETNPIKEARSLALDQPIPIHTDGDAQVLTIPELREGDVIVLH